MGQKWLEKLVDARVYGDILQKRKRCADTTHLKLSWEYCASMPNLSFVEMVVQVWLELEPEISHVLVASNVKRMPDGSKVGIEIETRNHLALVEAWEHAMCLDTTIYDADAKNGKILAAGSCNDSAEIMGRLTVLRNALLL